MITQINIENYKIIRERKLLLGLLNVLTGINSTGKSSIIQTLLLLRQSYERGHLTRPRNVALYLGEENQDFLTNPGTADSIFNFNAPRMDTISIEVVDDSSSSYKFESLPFEEQNQNTSELVGSFAGANIATKALFSDRFQYLSAHRIEPRSAYPLLRNNYDLGKDGRYAPAYLEANGSKDIPIAALRHPESTVLSLHEQVERWMAHISPDVRFKVTRKSTHVELRYFYNAIDAPTSDILPQNVGFGLTYFLPIVTALLSAQPNDLILIENPETHLHPYGQAKIAELMTLAAQNGVQIIVETHSDHIVNGTLLSCKRFEQNQQIGIDRAKVRIYYFERNGGESEVREIEVFERGRIKRPPKGFFDQIGKDVDEFHS